MKRVRHRQREAAADSILDARVRLCRMLRDVEADVARASRALEAARAAGVGRRGAVAA